MKYFMETMLAPRSKILVFLVVACLASIKSAYEFNAFDFGDGFKTLWVAHFLAAIIWLSAAWELTRRLSLEKIKQIVEKQGGNEPVLHTLAIFMFAMVVGVPLMALVTSFAGESYLASDYSLSKNIYPNLLFTFFTMSKVGLAGSLSLYAFLESRKTYHKSFALIVWAFFFFGLIMQAGVIAGLTG